MKWIEIDISEGIVRVDDITEGDLNSAGIRVVNFPENWKDKLVNAVFYRGTDSIDVRLKLNDDKDRLIGDVPTQMLAEDGSFKIVVYAVAMNQVEEPYRDVRPAVWAGVRDGLESAEVLPLDKDVGAYLTLLIDLQNKGASIDEMIERLGDIEAIKAKLESVADGAEVNVQADWSEKDTNSDAYVKNKPNLKEMEDRLSEEIERAWNLGLQVETAADANKEALELHIANGDEDVKHLTDSEKADVGKIGKIEADVGNLKLDTKTVVDGINALTSENAMQGNELKSLDALKANKAELKTVATSGSYADLSSVPVENMGEVGSLSAFDESKYREKSAIYSGVFGTGITFVLCVTRLGVGVIQTLLSGSLAEPVRVRQFINITGAWTRWDVPVSRYDWEGEVIHETYVRKDELTAPPIRVVPTTLNPNTDYNLGIQDVLTLTFPSVAKDGDVICISFLSSDTATNLTIDTTYTNDIGLVPEAFTGYEIYAKYNKDLDLWIVKYSEYSIEGM